MTSVLRHSTSTTVAKMPLTDSGYNVTCLNSHVFAVLTGTELEKRCAARPSTQLSAMIIAPEECPDCIEERRENQRKNAELVSLCGCPIGGMECTGKDEDGKDCPCVLDLQPIPNSQYDDQLRSYNPWEE